MAVFIYCEACDQHCDNGLECDERTQEIRSAAESVDIDKIEKNVTGVRAQVQSHQQMTSV